MPGKYVIRDLMRLTGLSAGRVHHYVELGLIQGPKPRGVAARYGEEQLVRLKVIALLRSRDRLELRAIKRRISGLSMAELQALLPPPPAEVKPPSASDGPSSANTQVPARMLEPSSAAISANTLPFGQRWDHVELVAGLELRVRSDAGPLLRRIATEIIERFAAQTLAPASPSAMGGELGDVHA